MSTVEFDKQVREARERVAAMDLADQSSGIARPIDCGPRAYITTVMQALKTGLSDASGRNLDCIFDAYVMLESMAESLAVHTRSRYLEDSND